MFDPKSSETIGYHLFFEPRGAIADEVAATIQKLSAEYSGPVFTPHVTLLARIPVEEEAAVVEKAAQVAGALAPLTLTLGAPDMEDAYFRALYLTIEEQDAMQKLHTLASQIFSMKPSAAYKAHMSLLYGNYPEERKKKTVESLVLPETRAFTVSSLHLYRTEGETPNWYRVQEFPFATIQS